MGSWLFRLLGKIHSEFKECLFHTEDKFLSPKEISFLFFSFGYLSIPSLTEFRILYSVVHTEHYTKRVTDIPLTHCVQIHCPFCLVMIGHLTLYPAKPLSSREWLERNFVCDTQMQFKVWQDIIVFCENDLREERKEFVMNRQMVSTTWNPPEGTMASPLASTPCKAATWWEHTLMHSQSRATFTPCSCFFLSFVGKLRLSFYVVKESLVEHDFHKGCLCKFMCLMWMKLISRLE